MSLARQEFWPWAKEAYKVWSLFDMLKFLHVGNFSSFMVNFERVSAFTQTLLDPPPQGLGEKENLLRIGLPKYREALSGILEICARGEIPLSYAVKRQLEGFYARLDQAEQNRRL
jgi:hypothetical protein